MPRFLLASSLIVIGLAYAIAAQDTNSTPRQVAPDVAQALLLRRVAPNYPPLARQARIQGTIVLDVIVNKAGDVDHVKLVSGHPMLAPAAIDAVKQWEYRPYEENGEPIEIQTTVRVNLTLTDNPPSGGVVGDGPPGSSPMQTMVDPVNVCEDTGDNSFPKRVRVSQGVMRGLLISKQPPIYPEQARTEHIEGTVLMAMEISREGSVCRIVLISGHPLLAPAAIDAVKQWKYRPYLLNGQPIEVETQAQQVNFTLKP